IEENHIRIFGDTAVVAGTYRNIVRGGGQRNPMKQARHLRVYVHRGGSWKVVGHHATEGAPRAHRGPTSIPQPPPLQEHAMDFGYFTLSDNYYPHNLRTASDFVLEIRNQAILADRLGFHSAWIGEHHFDRLGVNSRPDLLLASIIPETQHIRLAPAVN